MRICCIFDNFPHFSITFLAALLPCCQCFHRTDFAPAYQPLTISAEIHRVEEHKIPAILSLSGLIHHIYISLKVSYQTFHKANKSHGRNTQKNTRSIFFNSRLYPVGSIYTRIQSVTDPTQNYFSNT